MLKEYEKLLNLQAQAEKIFSDVAREDRDLKAEERDELKRLYEEGKELNEKVLEAKASQEMHNEIKSWHVEKKESRKSGSMADKILGNETFKQWYKSVAPSGFIPESRKGINSPSIEVKDFGIFKKALVTGASDTGAGAFIQNDAPGIYEALGYAPSVVRDLVSVRQTGSDTVEFVRQTTKVDDAAVVAEATSLSDGLKPETAVAYEKVTAPVETIAVWIPATKQALSDASQLRGMIEQELRADLVDQLEAEIFADIAADTNILTGAYDTDLLTTTRKALTNLMVNGLDKPSAWVFNPSDWESFELLQDSQSRYYYGGPMNVGPQRLWGVPVVQSFHVASGYAYLANWNKAVLWDREQASVSISDQHSDFFIRNLVAVLAELRAAFAITRPNSFVKVDLTAA